MVNVKQIAELLHLHFEIDASYQIDDHTGVVDVHNWVNVRTSNLPELPVQFGKVHGDFDCSQCGLTTLKGAPTWVQGAFNCSRNNLTTLTHAPDHVGQTFFCNRNRIESLVEGPSHVGRNYYCSDNRLKSLTGMPDQISGSVFCEDNLLTSLQGAPKFIGGEFSAFNNQLLDISHMPDRVVYEIYLSYHPELPVLRFTEFDADQEFVVDHAPPRLISILQKYQGKGKAFMLNMALELKQSGLGGNARW
jgi:hypothetical protein